MTCSTIQVVSGDSCASLATRCGISAVDFTKYNPSPTLCSSLTPGQYVCCSSGELPDLTPNPLPDGTCFPYLVESGDTCASLAAAYGITNAKIEGYNKETWGWLGCSNLQAKQNICLSTGEPPFPAPIDNTICGPQKPGTKPPENSTDWADLNPCPLNSCCNVWGQCGITPEFCTVEKSDTGAPGTTGCVSNCGTAITNNKTPPLEFINLGYFEAWAADRSCLTLDASQIPSEYTHVHFAFGGITDDFRVDLSEVQDQFDKFVEQTAFKRILSFGGWSFSTEADSFPIFREGVTPEQRETFAKSVVDTVNEYNLDGVDFDWEYPGAPGIPDIPPGSPKDGTNYLAFLKIVREIMPSEKSLAIAAPASYWYLKGFPIKEIAPVHDYIVYITYDLHGQWDYNNAFSNPGCPNGNCLRSHVNLTETEYSLAMITKAGVPAHKVLIGLLNYSRSFGMADTNCTDPGCLFTGPNSTATKGRCTGEPGYIANAEIYKHIENGAEHWHDHDSNSDIAVYGDSTWVAYMTRKTRNTRANYYGSMGFGGTVEWALDLEEFTEDVTGYVPVSEALAFFEKGLNTSNYDMQQIIDGNVTDLATQLVGFEGCDSVNKAAIYSGWQQSWKLMDHIYSEAKNGADFNSAAAIEFLGPPGLNSDLFEGFNAIFTNLRTIKSSWLPWGWKLHVRCDDPSKRCPCGLGGPYAYTSQKDRKSGHARINFCPRYFAAPNLDEAMNNGNDPVMGKNWYLDVTNYVQTEANVWIHELLHDDWVSGAGKNSIMHVTDYKMKFNIGTEETPVYKEYTANGPQMTKALAKWSTKPGGYTRRNADSMSMFIMARYIQKALGNIYPHLPVAPIRPIDVNDKYGWEGLFVLDEDGTATVNETVLGDLEWGAMGICAALSDEDGASDADTVIDVDDPAGFLDKSDYPEDYLSSLSSWLSPTPTSTPTPTPSEVGYSGKGSS